MIINRYEEELLTACRKFLAAADSQLASTAILQEHGFSAEMRERGHTLVAQADRAFSAERDGSAWNFLTPTPWQRRKEALDWFFDGRWRRFRQNFVAAERALKSGSPVGVVAAFLPSLSPLELAKDELTLARDLWRAGRERPADAAPPKDTVLVELQGWYEHWRLLAQRVFRGRDDLLGPFGLTSGKAPPRLRGKLAQIRYGEGAANRDARFPAA